MDIVSIAVFGTIILACVVVLLVLKAFGGQSASSIDPRQRRRIRTDQRDHSTRVPF